LVLVVLVEQTLQTSMAGVQVAAIACLVLLPLLAAAVAQSVWLLFLGSVVLV
jgi:hypothetical protein